VALALLSEVLNGVYSGYATRMTPPVHAADFFKMNLHYSQLEEALEEIDNVSALHAVVPAYNSYVCLYQ
jgi:TctA family transporter